MEKLFRVKRFDKVSSLADAVVLLCAKSNGCVWEKLTMQEIIGYVECERRLYPATNRDVVAIKVADHHYMINQGESPLVEIIDMEVFNDIPTLDVYDQSQN